MPRDLFGDVTRPSISIGNRKWYTVPVSLLSHSAIVAALVALPILAPALMPKIDAGGPTYVPITPLVPPAPPLPAKAIQHQPPENTNTPPTVAPDGIAPEKPLPEWQEPIAPGIVDGTITDSNSRALVEPPAPPPPPEPKPVPVGGVIRRPLKIHHVDPVYLPTARAAGIQGLVIIEATIGPDGKVVNARLLRGLPLLDQSALDAVRQWQFTPTLLNGVPVPVIMSVTVMFTLSR